MAATAPVAVCCPACWRWTELKSSTTCKRCGSPLILADGRRVDQARDGTAPTAVATNAPTVSLAPLVVGTDWISIARWIALAYGALSVLGIFAVGLLIPTISVPVQDANTGQIVDQTLNIRPFLAIVAFFAIVFYAVVVWLIKYGVARVIVLVVVVIGALAAASRLGAEPATAVAASVVSLLCDAGFAYVLTMTFLAPRRPAPVSAHASLPLPPAASPPAPPPLPPPLAPPSQ
ncbi:MAG: hypothetical protein WAL84_14730 [Candidatus Dormiibacterota bacterium]